MELSRRILSLSPSPTIALNAKAKQLRAEGREILNFAVGEPDFPTPGPIVNKVIDELKQGHTKYGPAGGSPAFRQAIADKLQRDNQLDFSPDQIVAGIGAKEILLHLCLSLINDEDEVLIPAPYWVSYTEQVKAAGGVPTVIPMGKSFDQAPISIDDLEKYQTPKTKGFILNSPNNPSGYILSQDQLKELGAYLKEKDWWIISDEIYEYLAFDHPHVSLLSLYPELKERFFVVNGLSKGFAMTGFRVGYAAGPLAAMKLVKSMQSHSSTCIPPFIEAAAIDALHAGSHLMAEEMAILKKRRNVAKECLDSIDNISYVTPQGAFYVFIDVRPFLETSSQFDNTLELGEHLLVEHNIALVPGEAFGTPGYLRFSYAASEDAIREGLGRLGEAVR